MKKLLFLTILTSALVGCQGDYLYSNRCVTRDTNHTFTKATIIKGNTTEEVEVVAWQDYSQSDSIQLWVKYPQARNKIKVFYTHLNNVILENPEPEFLPKFNKFF